MNPLSATSGPVGRITRRLLALERQLRNLRPLRATSHREIRRRPAPRPDAFGHLAPSALVLPPAEIFGADRVHIGERVRLHEGVSIVARTDTARVEIGDGTILARYAHIDCAETIIVGADVMSSDHVAVIDNWGPGNAPSTPAAVTIEDGAYLGYGCIVGPGVTVGAGAFIGEGAVVFDDVAPHQVVYGNPASPVRTWTGDSWTGTRFP